MGLSVVATPIGNEKDFSQRALETLRAADLIIGEERKALRQILKAAGVRDKELDQLNEHSTAKDIEHFVNVCREKSVALVSDCGTPGFCDPGADLVDACYKAGVPVQAVPGASSLMVLLSLAGVRLDTFVFCGFLSAKKEKRQTEIRRLQKETRPLIVMETPYRCAGWLAEISEAFPDRFCVLGLSLTTPQERLWRGPGRKLKEVPVTDSAEPIQLILPSKTQR